MQSAEISAPAPRDVEISAPDLEDFAPFDAQMRLNSSEDAKRRYVRSSFTVWLGVLLAVMVGVVCVFLLIKEMPEQSSSHAFPSNMEQQIGHGDRRYDGGLDDPAPVMVFPAPKGIIELNNIATQTNDMVPTQYACMVQNVFNGKRCGGCCHRSDCSCAEIMTQCGKLTTWQEGIDMGTTSNCRGYIEATSQSKWSHITDAQLQNTKTGMPAWVYALVKLAYEHGCSPPSEHITSTGRAIQRCVNKYIFEKTEQAAERAACEIITEGIAEAFCLSGYFKVGTQILNSFVNKYIEDIVIEDATRVEDAALQAARRAGNWFKSSFVHAPWGML